MSDKANLIEYDNAENCWFDTSELEKKQVSLEMKVVSQLIEHLTAKTYRTGSDRVQQKL